MYTVTIHRGQSKGAYTRLNYKKNIHIYNNLQGYEALTSLAPSYKLESGKNERAHNGNSSKYTYIQRHIHTYTQQPDRQTDSHMYMHAHMEVFV